MQNTLPQDWSREDFLALALQYAANADLDISDAEKAYMREICGEPHCAKAAAFYEQSSDYEVLQTLGQLKEVFFPGEEGSSELRSHLINLFRADEDFSHLEHNIMRGLERFLR